MQTSVQSEGQPSETFAEKEKKETAFQKRITNNSIGRSELKNQSGTDFLGLSPSKACTEMVPMDF